jgi:hypothetical protein
LPLDARTQQHLDRADRNRSVAQTLCSPGIASVLKPPPEEWAAVAAFYAAVHYVNAYLWEKLRLEPADHPERNRWIQRAPPLRPIFGAYKTLADLAWDARYKAQFQVHSRVIQDAVHQRLERVRAQVMCELNQSQGETRRAGAVRSRSE